MSNVINLSVQSSREWEIRHAQRVLFINLNRTLHRLGSGEPMTEADMDVLHACIKESVEALKVLGVAI